MISQIGLLSRPAALSPMAAAANAALGLDGVHERPRLDDERRDRERHEEVIERGVHPVA